MSEHRRKPPPQGGGRAAARRGFTGSSSGRRAAPPGSGGAAAGSYGAGEERPYGGRAEARRAAQRSGGRRRAPDGAGGGGRRAAGGSAGMGGAGGPGRGRGRGAEPPGKKRLIDYPRAGKDGWRKLVPSWKQLMGTFIGFCGLLVAAAGVGYALVDIPKPSDAARAQNNVYLWKDGSQMVATGGEYNRQIIPYAEIPKEMRFAVMSAENKTFMKDKGVDPMGIARAAFNMAKGGDTQGGSTITQQYVKNSMLSQDQTLTRKFRELFISIKVGAQMEKEEIMAGYLNTAYYGRGAYGIQAAARAYFKKDAEELNASQCAFLAAVLKGATYYDPAGATAIDPAATPQANRERAEKRWKWILDEMVKDKHLTRDERAEFPKFPEVESPRNNQQLSGQTGYLVNLAKSYILNNTDISEEDLQRGGYEIKTTFDKKKVGQLKKAVTAVYKENIDIKARPKKDTHVQFGGASVDPKDGAIVAIYGGTDYAKHFTNNADVTGAQVGSTFKPFVLAAAMRDGKLNPKMGLDQPDSERKKVSPSSRYNGKNDLKIKNYDGTVWQNEKGEQWLQRNDGEESYGTPPDYAITLREAMRVSANSPFVQLGMDVGIDKVRESAVDAGLLEDGLTKGNVPSVSVGIDSPSAIRMAGAYATFAAQGKQNDPYSVIEVKKKGQVEYKHKPQTKSPFDANVANNVTDVLKNVVDKGTGTSAKLPDRQVAGKTGTTDGNKSAWFVGYTPQMSTAISMYRLNDDAKAKNRKFLEMFGTGGEEKIHGASFPAQIWHDYMLRALKGTTPMTFTPPQPIGEVVFGGGAQSPSPTPTPTEEPDESTSPSPTEPNPSESATGEPGPGETCGQWEWNCEPDGGTSEGGTDGGVDGGETGGTTPTPEPPTGGDTGGDSGGNGGGGGFLGGPNG
ncbi:transglycosylase domain-containing protein [Streptomyces sp. NPDC002851]